MLCGKCRLPECYFEQAKKDLLAICNSCGQSKKLDSQHKAGKQLIKDLPSFYAMNPEFRKGKGPKIEEVSANQVSKALEQTKESKKQNEERAEELI